MKLLQLTLRDLFWLMLASAICCAWWVDGQRWSEKIAPLEQKRASYLADLKVLERMTYGYGVADTSGLVNLNFGCPCFLGEPHHGVMPSDCEPSSRDEARP
jgi:hypothetical protein